MTRAPEEATGLVRSIRQLFAAPRHCPVCERSYRKFLPHGVVPRLDARCPGCGSLERHRLTWVHLRQKTNLFDGTPKRMLHVAPEAAFEARFRALVGDGYLTADLDASAADVQMDICDIRYPDESFDIVYCSHVLEHVPDDRLAMREFRRVLKRDGWAVLDVPITATHTIEDPSITDPEERTRRFGQPDHVRSYGPDYPDRLREVGFHVDVRNVSDVVAEADVGRFGLARLQPQVFHCTKT
jgi:SAM-dependent methyltransferase